MNKKKIRKIKEDIIKALEEDEKKSPMGNLVGGFISILIGTAILKGAIKKMEKKYDK